MRFSRMDIDLCNKRWLSRILDVPYSTNGGIDLLDRKTGIELKSRYAGYPHTFTIHADQVDDFRDNSPACNLYWAFVLYYVKGNPKRLGDMTIDSSTVRKREVWLTEWDWVRQFPIWRPKTGPYIYIHQNPEINSRDDFTRIDIGRNSLFVPRGSSLEKLLEVPF